MTEYTKCLHPKTGKWAYYSDELRTLSLEDLEIELAYWKQYKPEDEDDEILKINRIRQVKKRLERVGNLTARSFQT